MTVDLRYSVFPRQTYPDVAVEGTSWEPEMWQVMRGSWDYSYGGMVDHVRNQQRFGHLEMDLEYNPLEDIEGYEDYFDSLVYAKNAEHMSVLKNQINERNKSREVLAQATLTQGLTAGLIDPINLIALPFGGPGVGLTRSFIQGAASTGLVQAALESGRYAADPTATAGEFGVNVGATAVFGGIISSATSVPLTRRAAAIRNYEQTHKDFLEAAGISDNLNAMTAEEFSNRSLRENRDFGSSSDSEISLEIENQEGRVFGIDQNLPDVEDEIFAAQQRYDSEGGSKPSQLEELEGLRAKKQAMLDQKELSEKMISTLKYEKTLRSIEDAELSNADNPYDFDSNMFINSPLFKFVTTPMKRILQSNTTNAGKKAILQLANDSGLALVANRLGQAIGPSVYQRAKVMEAEWVQAHRQLQNSWANSLGTRAVEPLGIDVTNLVEHSGKIKAKFTGTDKSRTYGEFLRQASEKRIKGIEASSDFEKEAIETMNKFYKKWEDRLEDSGLLGSKQSILKENKILELRIAEFEDKLTKYKDKSRAAEMTKKRIDYYRDKVDENNATIESLGDILPANEDVFSPRYWNLDAIRKDREGLEAVIASWYKQNPTVYQNVNGTMVRTELKGDADSIKERAKQTVDKILGIKDVADPDIVSYGYGKSKHLKSRELDIPTKLVYDYVIQDPMAIMKTYSHKTAAVYQFHKMYDGRRLPEVLDDLEESMILEGKSQKEINAYRKDFDALYRRIVGSPISDPTRWDNTMTNVMKDFAYLNYLGSSGFSAIPDFARIVMEHDMGDIIKSLTSILDKETIKLSRKERDFIGEGLDILQGSSHMRLTEHVSNNPLENTKMDMARNVYSIANLLGPMTVIGKNMDIMVRGHTIIKLSKQWADPNGKITNKDATYLARYNIDEAMAKKIAAQPYETTSKGLYLPNTSEWIEEEVTETFRTAMQSGVLNTIMMGTPADRPIITDGVVYVPYRIAKAFGYQEDKIAKGYSRMESGILGLPFQFMSYSMAAMNKVTASYSQNQIRNRSAGVLAAMGLGYMAMKIKTKDYVWDNMSASDKFVRSFDQSGLLSLYSDLMYTSINTSMALGHGNFMEGLVKAKFAQEENTLDAVNSVLGAGPSIATDLTINPVIDFINGDYGEGMDTFLSNLPGMRLWFLKDEVNEMTRGISRAF